MGRNILYGYRIENGKAVVDENEAEMIRKTAKEYLGGKSFTEAARNAGIIRNHGTVRVMFENPAYLGTDFYPPILDEETFIAISVERNRRVGWIERDFQSKRIVKPLEVKTVFRVLKNVETKYADPYTQAAYAYSLIESEV